VTVLLQEGGICCGDGNGRGRRGELEHDEPAGNGRGVKHWRDATYVHRKPNRGWDVLCAHRKCSPRPGIAVWDVGSGGKGYNRLLVGSKNPRLNGISLAQWELFNCPCKVEWRKKMKKESVRAVGEARM